ncbi:hypothetical protein DSO57_1010858 [Entomophthora muscae]|uniref:Uncharacterized protein n=1 Tax=Entomophthora muscae TaxID=34485 RepID=A0ACC2TTE6_9FUNG|nr:hypothetical protein DSO57_1010858 [Entomophthora muscae]
MVEKVKPVLDTSYKPYVNDGNLEEDKGPEFYRTDEGQLVLKKISAFYNKVPIPCVVPNANRSIPTSKTPAQKRIPGIKHIILLKLMSVSGDCKAATCQGRKTKAWNRVQAPTLGCQAKVRMAEKACWGIQTPNHPTGQARVTSNCPGLFGKFKVT